VDGRGYVWVRVDGRWRMEHRLVVEREIGRRLKRGEVVHHVNHRRDDNRVANLMLFGSQSGHTAYHAGRAAKVTWDGRTARVEKPATPGDGPAVRVRIVKSEPVRWRELLWFQGGLKRLSPANLNRLKESIRRRGIIDGFRVWEESPGVVWILDGHQRRRALTELESEGFRLPDEMPGFWVECRDRAEAAELVLLYSSQYGEMVADEAVEFVRTMGVDLAGAAPTLNVPRLDFDALRRDYLEADGRVAVVEEELGDVRPSDGFCQVRIEDAADVPTVVAFLNRLGIAHRMEGQE